jgi:branched-chain amino acid transport system substrate-binding protein
MAKPWHKFVTWSLISILLLLTHLIVLLVALNITIWPLDFTASQAGPLKVQIGVAIAQSQKDNPLGLDQLKGIEVAKEYFKSYICNDLNPDNGQNPKSKFCIDLVTDRDARGDNETAVSVFKTLIYTDGVAIIIGPTYSEQAQYAHPEAEDAQVPVIAVSNTAAGIPEIGWFISRVSAPVAVYAPFALSRIQSSVERVAVIYRDNDKFTLSETLAFTQVITKKDSGLTLIPPQPYTNNSDYTTAVNAVLAMNPDLVIVSGRFKDGYSIIQELRKQGFVGPDKYIIGGNGINATDIFNSCGQACDGVYIAQAYNPLVQDTAIQQNFLKAYNEVGYEGLPSQITAQMFTALQVIVEALVELEKNPEFENMKLERLRAELNVQLISSDMQFDSVLGPIWFDREGEVCQKEFYVAQINNPDGDSGQFKIDPTPRTVPLSDRNGCYREFLGQR